MMTTLTPTPDDVAYLAKAKMDDEHLTARILMERAVVRHAATALIAAGCELRLHDGEDFSTERTTSVDLIMAELMATDDEHLWVYGPDDSSKGWIYLVYGNDGYDVISDHSVSLTELLKSTDAFSDTLMPGA